AGACIGAPPTATRPDRRRPLGHRRPHRLPRLRLATAGTTAPCEPRPASVTGHRLPQVRQRPHGLSAGPSRTLYPDVVIIGAGFAGSLTALALRSRGVRVAIIERGRHPRFAIGESTTPLTNLLLEELADTYALPQIRPFSKWATWQAHRPDVAVGL